MGGSVQLLGPWTDSGAITALAGGKARGLHTLHNSGFAVPEWTVLGTDVFDAFVAGAGLTEPITAFAAADTPDAASETGAALRAAIESAELPAEVAALIADGYGRLGGAAIAVRSSVAAEDGPAHSYAGQFDSFLNVNGEDAVADRVRACWASAFSERSIRYAFAHDQPRVAAVAVVLQRLVPARISGVMFTANPASGSADELVISAVYGLGEGLVSGAVDADSVVVDRAGTVLDTVVGDKDQAFVPDAAQGSTTSEVDPQRRARLALTEAEIASLAELGRKLEAALGAPQDIEWAIDDDGVWFLQARPITTALAAVAADRAVAEAALIRGAGEDVPDGEARIWDNSNIIESFSGLTSPLTYTTAADIYGRVYRGYAESLKVPAEQLRQTDEWTPVLLGYFHGRVYYNLLHWYRMVGIAPGYPLNRKVLEAALGVDEPLADDIAKTLRPYTFGSTGARIRSRAVTTVTYLRRLFGIDEMVEQFFTEFYRVYDEYEAIDYTTLTGEQAYAAYRRVDRDLVQRWGPLMVLDAILLTCTGAMFLLTKLFLPKAPEWFLYAVVGPGADVESAEPARALTAMAEIVHADPELTALINSTEPQQIYRQLHTSDAYAQFRAEVDAYIDRYGYRSLDELKLETPDLREDPASLFVMLRSALGRVGQAGQQPDRGAEADEYLDAHLTGVRRRIYERLRAKVSRCAAHRERLRFCRTRAFGMVKRMIRVMGRDLAARGVIDEFADVFYLTVQELRGSYEGADTADLRDLVAARKVQRAKDAELVAPARFTTVGSTFGRAELASQGWVPVTDTPPALPGTVLAGTPSASGLVEGAAVVVDEPCDVAGGILIAYRTDPGWVAALPSASALVIERGSPLTHVAIVARELGVPTVVQVKDITKRIRTGMHIRVDGTNGTVTVLSGGESGDE
ncbi:phosphoenolpyruvate synthase [Nocardia cyriacigeorgica]|uniref:phosphoenolpyruvate synthase n=1 Tax=Nocardia cyriacigeorgica TaxID=135487 RepID=UPI002457620C|nr:phosphoenolpyruvate synthase [Nocardia cyriacigeorgica]